jgi:DNA (cytosine-5)-methyltransferase 1
LNHELTRNDFYSLVDASVLDRVLTRTIGEETLDEIFSSVDNLVDGQNIDLIVGGPPCQAYSVAGRSRDINGMLGDPRNYLYKYYAKFLERYQPRYFVFENVVGLLTASDADGERYFDKMRTLFAEIGYSTEYKVLNAKDFGVLQNRRRIILVGRRRDINGGGYPVLKEKHFEVCVSELLEDLPPIKAGEGTPLPVRTLPYEGSYLFEMGIKQTDEQEVTLHNARPHTDRDLEIYRIAVNLWNSGHKRLSYSSLPSELRTQENTETFLDRFKVVAGDLPYSQTIVAHISKDGHYFIHPDLEQNRSLTPREAARIQTFPDNYFFESASGRGTGRTAAFKQIGNAVPVGLARAIAKGMKGFF